MSILHLIKETISHSSDRNLDTQFNSQKKVDFKVESKRSTTKQENDKKKYWSCLEAPEPSASIRDLVLYVTESKSYPPMFQTL